ncbi:unnamed protein product [Caenorhabditis brenneri]
MSSSTISLLHLPNTAIKNVLKSSDVREFIIFSTLSVRAKCLAKSIKWKSESIWFNPQHGCLICDYRKDCIFFGDKGPNEPCPLLIKTLRESDIQFAKPEFGVREWFKHFLFIFNHPKVHVQFVLWENDWVYSLESVQKLLEGSKIDRLEVFNAFGVLRHYPLINYLTLGNNDNGPGFISPKGLKHTRKALLGNLPRVEINRSFFFNLDTLLMMNCPEIESTGDLISDKELNTFLKLWLKGCHRNLKRFSYRSRNWRGELSFRERIVLKGIKYDKEKGFDTHIFGAYHIFRKVDATKATVILTDSSFKIIVHP